MLLKMGEVNFVKGQYYTILALIFAIIVAIFAISNAGPVDISFCIGIIQFLKL